MATSGEKKEMYWRIYTKGTSAIEII